MLLQHLKLRAIEIRDEYLPAQNTAVRVGQLLYDMIENITDADELNERYLRKDIEDFAAAMIRFLDGLETG
jgi:hypothetical protein